MKALKHTIFTLVLIALLKLLEVILNKFSPVTGMFHRQLLFVIQVLLLSGLLISFLLKPLRLELPFFAWLFLWTALVMALDYVFFLMLGNPHSIPAYAKKTFRDFYTAVQRNIIQYEPAAKYDSI